MTRLAAMPQIPALGNVGRLPSLSATGSRISVAEMLLLIGAGVASTVMGMVIRGWGVPGSNIVQSVLPMALGIALVPRRGAGIVLGSSSLATGLVMLAMGSAEASPSALARMFLLGLCLEVATHQLQRGRSVWLWFMLAGLATNLIAFGLKLLFGFFGLELLGGKRGPINIPFSLMSWTLCGALAGWLCAVAFFRRSPDAESATGNSAAEGD